MISTLPPCSFEERVHATLGGPLHARGIDVLQVNLGYRCNMACKHCHVDAGPGRTEMMSRENVELAVRVLGETGIGTLDLTGGAPELHPDFRWLVREASGLGQQIIVRSNLTIFFEDGMEDLAEFYRDSGVEIVASLPYYLGENVDRVRGRGVFEKCIVALRRLNNLGFGKRDASGLRLNLVYNPQGAFLPPPQAELEATYRQELLSRHGVVFDGLFTFANMPIGRFAGFLERSANKASYLSRLVEAFNPDTLEGVMCRSLISVNWQGRLFDCDFNQIAGLPVLEESPPHLREFDLDRLSRRRIALAEHCYGCTAGQGST